MSRFEFRKVSDNTDNMCYLIQGTSNGYVPKSLGTNPGETMATGIEEYLAERGVTMSILEAFDEGLKRTQQKTLDSFGVLIDPKQTTLTAFSQEKTA